MGLERYVVDAVVLEGRSARELARDQPHFEELDLRTGGSLPRRWLRSPDAAVTAPAVLLAPGQQRHPGPDPRAPQ
jgi:hypothetical protein